MKNPKQTRTLLCGFLKVLEIDKLRLICMISLFLERRHAHLSLTPWLLQVLDGPFDF